MTKSSKKKIQKVKDFETMANKSQIITFNFSSGSTGPPKLQMFKNQVPLKFPESPSDGLPELLGKWELFKLALNMMRNGRVASLNGNFNGFIALGLTIGNLVTAVKMKLTYVVLNQRQPESWAELINYYKIPASMFYTPILTIFINTEAFKELC